MLIRFSLYGFLKNQRYFEPFLYLALLEKGLSFLAIGLLVSARELTVNLLEIPSGAAADVFGRRASMVFSFLAYIASFTVFGFAREPWLLVVAMVLFGVGDSFRTGTHKAMIFTWLRRQGREAERTRVYGYTRSWSKIGSAVSGVIAAALVFLAGGYTAIFFASIVPYAANIVNFLGYPREVDGQRSGASLGAAAAHAWSAIGAAFRGGALRRLVFESMGFEGFVNAAKDYLQPVLQAAALAWLGGTLATSADGEGLTDVQRTALLVGIVAPVLHLLCAVASRLAHRVADRAGGEEAAARFLWRAVAVVWLACAVAGFVDWHAGLIVGFIAAQVVMNAWRPILVSRFDAHADEKQGATIMSIENQAQRTATMIFAPVLGLAVDLVTRHGPGGSFWPVGAVGVIVALAFVRRRPARASLAV